MRTTPFTEMDRFFDRFPLSARMSGALALPAEDAFGVDGNVTVETTDEGYAVAADLPGFDADELELSLVEDVLHIEGRHEDTESEDAATRSRTRRVSERVRLPRALLAEEATASYRNGVLEVSLPFEEHDAEQGTRIDIE